MEESFVHLRELACNACMLTIPLPSDSFSLETDASALGILQVERDREWRSVKYYARQTHGAEKNYSATELEALAIVEAVKHFSHYMYWQQFVIYTDHRALCSPLTCDRLNKGLRRFALKLQEWAPSIQYKPGRHCQNRTSLNRAKSQRHVRPGVLYQCRGNVGARPNRRRQREMETERPPLGGL